MNPSIPPPIKRNAPKFNDTLPAVINGKLKGITPGTISDPKNTYVYCIRSGGILKYPAITAQPMKIGIIAPIMAHARLFVPINIKSHETKKNRKTPPKM